MCTVPNTNGYLQEARTRFARYLAGPDGDREAVVAASVGQQDTP